MFRRALRCYSTATPAGSVAASSSGPTAPSNVFAGIIVSRNPIVTPQPSEFESAYYHYQDELQRRLMWTFPQFYYYKKGSLSERKFVAAQRGPVAKQPGVYYPRGAPDVKFNRERRFKQEIVLPRDEEPSQTQTQAQAQAKDSFTRKIDLNSRITPADDQNDTKSLSRKLDRTLYLVTNDSRSGANAGWKFPTGTLEGSEHLHDGAERILRQLGGDRLNTWTVSNTPCAVINYKPSANRATESLVTESDIANDKEFYIKSHILDGQFVPANGIDFAWLTKEEIAEYASDAYYDTIKAALSNQ